MKFSSLTIILIICCLFLNLSSSLAKENNIKVQKTNNLKAKKIADSSTIKKSAIKIKKLETRNSTSTTGMYVGALIDSNWKYQGPEAKKG